MLGGRFQRPTEFANRVFESAAASPAFGVARAEKAHPFYLVSPPGCVILAVTQAACLLSPARLPARTIRPRHCGDSMPNPFFNGGHVQPEAFVGRKAELRRIFSALDTAHTGQLQSIAVVGPRRIGKSSLLFYVAHRFAQHLATPQNYRFAYVDLQKASSKTLDSLLIKILAELGAPKNAKTMPLAKFEDAVVALKAKGRLPVILLDEFEELTQKPEVFTNDLYDSWRALMNASAAAFITASRASLGDLAQAERYTSPFFNIFTYLTLGELTADDAEELIRRGATCDRPFSDGERNNMFLLGENHPYKLQLAGRMIYDAKADGEPVDWDKLRDEFESQLRQVDLKLNLPRKARALYEKSKAPMKSAAKSTIQQFVKAWIDRMTGQ